MQYKENNHAFDTWDPVAYLEEYFPRDVDNEPIVQFISKEAGSRLSPTALAIDVGCGPTVCYWSAMASHIKEIHLADYLDANLHQMKLWLNCANTRYDWTYYTEMILRFEGLEQPSWQDTIERENLSREKVKKILHCDISQPDPIGIEGRGRYDCVLSACCADSITHDKDLWWKYMKNIFTMLRPGGVFIGAAMRNCSSYNIGNIAYPSAHVNEQDFWALLKENNFNDVTIEIADESRPILDVESSRKKDLRSEYDQIVLVAGTMEA